MAETEPLDAASLIYSAFANGYDFVLTAGGVVPIRAWNPYGESAVGYLGVLDLEHGLIRDHGRNHNSEWRLLRQSHRITSLPTLRREETHA